ncbi:MULTISPECIES: TonB-dependent receptor [unclassified Janthinobacterium]|uniref:TonB-dependent receptor n=1 Tax=unclassified Janthinobacterium TaxID=2610881 RepID=UPI001E5D6973|nr:MULTISPECIES: TonB-dependent receptor [unclassified Janthinobacterium]MCC7641681.1 TonB-dependent receptor [Janthinobacterium sp. EB271-G4-3-1]MCC7690934.1 TonB-dependent receptor [Janthinobacterium sp. EB271-G4-3-2]
MLRKTVLVRALSIAFSTAALTAAVVPTALAQSNAAGNIYGNVEAAAGSTVVLLNTDTGLKRTIVPDSTGRYFATALPPGHYKVELVRDGQVSKTVEVDVLVGQGVDASFANATPGVQAVQVTGRRNRIDVSSSNNGATFTAKELDRLPIAHTVAAIIQLAPNTTRADSRYAAGASFGGGGASENAYYINGFPVTNPLTQLGASELPFGAIAQAQVLTGGFGAEFGRSVGGVVNITTKSGTNNWEFGATASIEPDSLRSTYKNSMYAVTGAPENSATDGTLLRRNSENSKTERIYGAYVGGPIIQDKLFMFLSAETRSTDWARVNGTRTSASNNTTGFVTNKDKIDRYFGKFDWNITDNHRLELSLIGDEGKTDRNLYGYDYSTSQRGAQTAQQHYKNNANFSPSVGAETQILRYLGNLTDNLTVTALYGESKTPSSSKYDPIGTAPADLYQVVANSNNRVPGLNYSSPQVLSGAIDAPEASNKVKSSRFDLEYKIGQHTLRGGFDNNKLSSENAGEIMGGGGQWSYSKTANPNALLNFGGGYRVSTASGGGYGTQGYYVRKQLFDTRTDAFSDQSAQYLEDRYQATKDLLVTVGLRNESFTNKNGDGQKFLEIKNQLSPRLAAAWDVNGDASLKVYGSAGRYAVQIPTHLAVRGASRSLFTYQYYTYTGTDQYGQPTGLNPLTGAFSTNNELGQEKDYRTVTAVDLKPTYQDELTLGFEKAFSPSLNFGAKVTYRKLRQTIDDYCDDRAVQAWADRNSVDTSNWGGLGCVTFNPGKDNTFRVDFNGDKKYTLVHLSADELGFDKAKRTYTAIDLFAEHPFRNGWYGRVNYTWSRSKGNTEGQTRSDNAQTDVAATSTWDTPELMYGADGLLPNDREHQIKAFGYYELNPEWSVGGNALLASGRPRSCFGNKDDLAEDAPNYGSVYFFCDGKNAPRGSYGKLPWDVRLDANVAYRPSLLKGLTLKMDVFNVFNKQTVQVVEEQYNVAAGNNAVNPLYGRGISYTSPRAVKLTAEYNYKF